MTHKERIKLRKKYKNRIWLADIFFIFAIALIVFILTIPFFKSEIFLWIWVGLLFISVLLEINITSIGSKFDRERFNIKNKRHIFYREKMYEAIKNRNYDKIIYFSKFINQNYFRIEANGALFTYYLLMNNKEINKKAEKHIKEFKNNL